MKKTISIGIVLTLVLTVISGIIAFPGIAHTESDPFVVTLWAGQNIDVGTISVWNDGTDIHVTYATTGGWLITETHLYVGKTDPTLLSHSPGQFPYSHPVDPADDEDSYVIPLLDIDGYHLKSNKKGKLTGNWEADGNPGVEIGDEIFIAAHAVVVRTIDDCFEEVWMIGYEETNDCGGDLTNYANEFNWFKEIDTDGYDDPVGNCENGPTLGVNVPSYTDPFIVGTSSDYEFPYNSNSNFPYATDFDVQWDGELLFGGLLTVSWSPGRSYPAETKVLNGDGIPTDTTFIQDGTAESGQGYFLNTYPVYQDSVLVDPLSDGTHTINFQHTQGDGTFWDWVKLEKPCEQWETAWGDGTEFSTNWATYFEYTTQCPPLEMVCPGIIRKTENIEMLDEPPCNVQVNTIESDAHFTFFKEFEGPLPADLQIDLVSGRSAKSDGPDDVLDWFILEGTEVCIFYIQLDNVGTTSTITKAGSITFGADILGAIISGGDIGTFALEDLMFDADDMLKPFTGITYPTKDRPDYLRGFDVNHPNNLDDALITGPTIDFTMWVVNAHDSMRIIVPMVPEDEHDWVLVDTVNVDANTNTPISSVAFENGEEYKIVASGVANAGDTIDFDAEYSITNRIVGDTWTDDVSGYESYGPNLLDLKVNGEFVDWGSYNPGHEYTIYLTGTGTPSSFELVVYDIYYPNNVGFITVEIYQWI